MISKMEPNGSRIGVVFNGSPMFVGDAGSGESEIRKWLIENDLLETIVQLPDSMFFNTGITTYIWIISNKKTPERIGKVQLINGSAYFNILRKLGDKKKEISKENLSDILEAYLNFEENDHSKIFDNSYFGYSRILIEQPLVEDGEIKKTKNDDLKPNVKLRDYERVPFSISIDEYFTNEIKPYLPNAWMDRSKDKIGYEINFVKEFFKYVPLKDSKLIKQSLLKLDKDISDGIKDLD